MNNNRKKRKAAEEEEEEGFGSPCRNVPEPSGALFLAGSETQRDVKDDLSGCFRVVAPLQVVGKSETPTLELPNSRN